MSVAAETALVLDDWVRQDEPPLAFQRRMARSVTTPWLLATADDYCYPTTEGGQRDLTQKVLFQPHIVARTLRGPRGVA